MKGRRMQGAHPRGARQRRPARRPLALPIAAAVAVAALLAWSMWPRSPGTGTSEGPPNRGHPPPDVLLVTIDTLRADRLGARGPAGPLTPTLDSLATRGVRFANAVAHVPLTLPSHASILTGLTPLRHGVRDNARFVLPSGTPTLQAWFAAAGYRTSAFVSAFTVHRRFGLAQGFEVYDDRFPRGDDPGRPAYVERRGDRTVEAALAWLGRQPAGSAPVFTWVHLFDPHAPYEAPQPFGSRYAGREYDGEVAFADRQVEVLLWGWKKLRGREPLVLVTSDHGEGLGEHGEPTHGLFVYDSTVRVPFVVAGPGVPAGRAPATLARGIDIAPTLLDVAGVPAPPGLDGRSLRGAWEGELHDEPAYVESLYGNLNFGWAPLHGWRTALTMYVSAPTPELYDLAADPGQLRNVAEERRDEAAAYERILSAAVASASGPAPAALPREARERMRAVGYLDGPPAARPSLRDPKGLAAVAARIERAVAIERLDPRAAARELRSILDADPANPLARRHLAIALGADGRHDEAAGEARRLVAGGDTSEETEALLADSLRLAGRPAEALAFLKGASAGGGEAGPDVLNATGRALLALGRAREASSTFERALAAAPGDPAALAGLTESAARLGDLQAARRWLELLRERDPEDPETALRLGAVLVRLGEAPHALPLLRFAAERRPRDPEALLALGGALAKTGRPAEAAACLERAVRASPAPAPAALNALAAARLESGDRRGAAEALRRSLRAQPDQPGISDLLRRIER